GDNIRVNTINPGLVLTPDWVKTAKQIAGEAGYDAHLQGVADEAGGMKRFATPEEVANFFVFLCSDKASYSTGSTYYVDGGWLRTVELLRRLLHQLCPRAGRGGPSHGGR